jgi:hypothetical protein
MTSEPGDDKALADIEQYGCQILHVLEDESGPGFSYSIGIEKTSGQPELLVTGLKRELAHSIINQYNQRVRAGERFEPDRFYSGFLGEFEVMFRRVLREHYEEYFGWGRWLYKGDDFRVYQLIWPSTRGVWPWDPKAPHDYTYFIPILCEPFSTA